MKHGFTLLMSIIILVSLLGVSCATPAPSPAQAPSAKSAPAVTPSPSPVAAKIIELKFQTQDPEDSLTGLSQQAYMKQIENATGDRVKITSYFNQTLMKATEAFEGTVTGRTDISWGYIGYFPGQFLLTEVITLPFMGVNTAELGGRIIQELYEENPEIQKEWAKVKVLELHTTDRYWPATTKKAGPLLKLADWQGKRLRVPGGPPTEMAKKLGAVPMVTSMPDVYLTAQKGVIDGAPIVWQCIQGFRHNEVF